MLCVYQLVPKDRFATFSSLVAVTIALATITGPIIGGALGHDKIWRWLFYLNLPPGAIVLLLALVSMPPDFAQKRSEPIFSAKSWKYILWRLDLPGIFLLLGGSLVLVTVLDETNSHFSWSSAKAIALIIVSAVLWIGFIVWEILASNEKTSFLVGVPYNSMIVYLPQRFQVLLGDSALMAGARLLGYSGVTAFSSTFAIIISTKLRVPFLPILIFGAMISIAGTALFSTLPLSNEWPASGYGYEIMAGCGMGIAYGISMFALPYMLDLKDVQEASGIIVQMRYLGSSVGVSIASNILNGRLKTTSNFLSNDASERLSHNVGYISKLALEDQHRVQENLAESYRIQFQVLIGFAVAQLAVSFLLIRRGAQIRPSET
ncbi:major facilitator superfamily domain-containing protein [Penicillium brevicompactum]|uniref:major facilitator superfamily domain-containing protein n=1 Tax=Penicillium brevicompactum TaxID=5074 RepID=UPI002541808D|nr:major facilitator superfamily domain-containing protein [Penicillium brevicompactum]KAJ5336917.1 major facilitator superfamily domain-containing protein [Penicillium brevicompactum]